MVDMETGIYEMDLATYDSDCWTGLLAGASWRSWTDTAEWTIRQHAGGGRGRPEYRRESIEGNSRTAAGGKETADDGRTAGGKAAATGGKETADGGEFSAICG